MLTAIIIGSSRGISFLDSGKSYPASLQRVHDNESVLDWNLATLKKSGVDKFVYVGGYHVEKVVQQHPDLQYVYHSGWDQEGTVNAFLCGARYLQDDILIVDDQIIFNSKAVTLLLEKKSDIVLCTSCINDIKSQNVGIPDNDLPSVSPSCDGGLHFAGLIKCTADGVKLLLDKAEKLVVEDNKSNLTSLSRYLQSAPELVVDSVDLTGECSFLNRPSALSQFVFGTKAQTLDRLQSVLKTAEILDQVRFTVYDWRVNPDLVLDKIADRLSADQLVVRSSALSEDAWIASSAGRFRSILNIDAHSRKDIGGAIEKVIASYLPNGEVGGSKDQVFVQPQVVSAEMSGVMFTRELESHAPYYVINYHLSHKTDSVTSGNEAEIKTVIVYKDGNYTSLEDRFRKLIEMAKEVEFLMGCDCLDIEFAYNKNGQLFLLQVRPIATTKQDFVPNDDDFSLEIEEAREFVNQFFKPCPSLVGDSVILSNMSDWNPAELVGANPRPLALSIFKYLITDSVWGQARAVANYRDTSPASLLVTIAGQPYIDVRASFNSFIPAAASEGLSAKCVNGYLRYLSENHHLHDKVEFDVAVTCMTFDFNLNAKHLEDIGLSSGEVEELKWHLLTLTDNLIQQKVAPFAELVEELNILAQRRELLLDCDGDTKTNVPKKILHLLDDCVRYGTLPFSIMARNGFIALSILRSIYNRGVFSRQEYEQCQQLTTVATEVSSAMMSVLSGKLALQEFLLNYGHLRPGTYDILSPNYRQAPHIYLASESAKLRSVDAQIPDTVAIGIFDKHSSEINELLKELGFVCTPFQLRDFIFNSIKGREFAKFEYTKNINFVLELISKLGKMWGLNDEELSYLSIHDIVEWASASQHCAMANKLKRQSMFEKKRYALNCSVKLPNIICNPVDIECFSVSECKPNFITTKTISAEVVALSGHVKELQQLQGKIVLIKNADPGFDWIFAHDVAGLITQYGGVASHMSIRAAEFGLPAAIGCGEAIFEQVLHASMVTLDCVGQQIKVIY